MSALRAMDLLGVDLGIFQETKVTGGIYARSGFGYSVFATDAPSPHCGGVALFWRESDLFEVEAERSWGANVISFQLVTGLGRYYVIGGYIPPSDMSPLSEVKEAWKHCPKGAQPIWLGDLNADIEYPKSERDVAIAEQAAAMDLVDQTRCFKQRRRRLVRGRWTWRQMRRGSWYSSHPDYFLAREGMRARFKNVALRLPHTHDSDHRAIVATIHGGHRQAVKRYRRTRRRFPIRLHKFGPRTELEHAFEELKVDIEKPTTREYKRAAWVSAETWKLVDQRAQLRRDGLLTQTLARQMGRKVKASLKVDRTARAEAVATEVEGHLHNGELKEAWRSMKGWYRAAEGRTPKPCYQTLASQTKERIALYAKREPPGNGVPINVTPYPVDDDTPTDLEIRRAVRKLSNGRAGGASKMRAEDIKQWLFSREQTEKSEGNGAGDMWELFTKLIQAIWEKGEIPPQMTWIIIVLLPKGGGDFRGIGLLEPAWKVIEILMDARLQVVEIHDCLHGFCAGRGTGTATLEVKLTQQLAHLEQAPLYGIFIDLRKAYDAMDRDECEKILEGYGVGPRMLRIIVRFWKTSQMVCRAGGYYDTSSFQAERGVTQGGPVSPRIFNIIVDAVVREWFRSCLDQGVAAEGLKELI